MTEDPIEQPSDQQALLPDTFEPEAIGVTTPAATDGEKEARDLLPFLVAGIGASAGGVEAYIELFKSLAPDTGMAFVVVPHLAADQKSHLVEIIARHTTMP